MLASMVVTVASMVGTVVMAVRLGVRMSMTAATMLLKKKQDRSGSTG